MSFGVLGNYILRLKFGEQDVNINPDSIIDFSVVEYLNRFLPSLVFKVKDPSGVLTHFTRMDSQYNVITVTFSLTDSVEESKEMKFRVYRRFPESRFETSGVIQFECLLDVKNAFSPEFERGWSDKSIYEILTQLSEEMGFSENNIDERLNEVYSLVQPGWTNVQFLKYLYGYLSSVNREYAYLAFADCPIVPFRETSGIWGERKRFNFTSLTKLLRQPVKFEFANISERNGDTYPVYTFEMADNLELLGSLGVNNQRFGYFKFETGEYINGNLQLPDVDFVSLSRYFAHDSIKKTEGPTYRYLGRTNDFIKDYTNSVKSKYYKRLNSLVKVWIGTDGIPNASPGDIIKLVYLKSFSGESIFSYQYSGFWLIERVVHNFSGTYYTMLLLTRPGYDTDLNTTFVSSENYRKS